MRLIDWLDGDEQLRAAILENDNMAEEFKKSLNKIVRYVKSKNFNDAEYKNLVNKEVDKIDKLLKENNFISQNNAFSDQICSN